MVTINNYLGSAYIIVLGFLLIIYHTELTRAKDSDQFT